MAKVNVVRFEITAVFEMKDGETKQDYEDKMIEALGELDPEFFSFTCEVTEEEA